MILTNMVNYQGAPLDEQIKDLLKKNLAYAQENYKINKKIQRYIFWGRLLSVVYLILIVAPLILGVIYLPAFLKGAMGGFLPQTADSPLNLSELLNGGNVNQQDLLKAIEEQGGLFNVYKNLLPGGQDN